MIGSLSEVLANSLPGNRTEETGRLRDAIFVSLLAVATFAAYQPAWNGGMLWDDQGHLTRPELRSLQGLQRIWFDLGATQQYYPLLHSAFWLEYRLWGDRLLAYHLAKIGQHLLAAVLILCILRRLNIPGAYLAAAVFALHPVHVESVAWITEQKNTLSAVFYLGAMLSYLAFDQDRANGRYVLALVLFLLALLTKTVTATLPAALLVVFWWRRGRITWRSDVLPLLPFFLLAAAGGMLTAWVERTYIGAQGVEFQLTPAARVLIAGRAVWFYLGKLLYPANLIFIYPRWHVTPSAAWQWFFPLSVLAFLAAFWFCRRRTRAPLAAALLFIGTLFPVLGFLNVYPFVYSFVADHFQYLASVPVIALLAAGAWSAWERCDRALRATAGCAGILVLLLLATLTWRQSRAYADVETLYRTTIARNPDCAMAYNNLGNVLLGKDQAQAAAPYFQKAIAIDPDSAEYYNNLGFSLSRQGRIKESLSYYEKAIAIRPNYGKAHANLAAALAHAGRNQEALVHYEQALELDPHDARACVEIGNMLARAGKLAAAAEKYQQALRIRSDCAEAHNNLANVLAQCGRIDLAATHYQQALAIDAEYADAHYNLANLLAWRKQIQPALQHYQRALTLATAQKNSNLAQLAHSASIAVGTPDSRRPC